MTRPRFHLATILLATLVFSGFVGLNLLTRARMMAHFRIYVPPPNRLGEYLINPYSTPRYSVGWPTEMTAYPKILTSSDIIPLQDPTAGEREELKRLIQSANADHEWNSAEFQALAPELTKRYFGETPFQFPYPELLRPQFLKLHQLKECTWNATHISINTAVALVITLALAALCEVLLRRKKPAPRS